MHFSGFFTTSELNSRNILTKSSCVSVTSDNMFYNSIHEKIGLKSHDSGIDIGINDDGNGHLNIIKHHLEPIKTTNLSKADSGAESNDEDDISSTEKKEIWKAPSILIPDEKWRKCIGNRCQVSCINIHDNNLHLVYETLSKRLVCQYDVKGNFQKMLYNDGTSKSCVHLKNGHFYISDQKKNTLMCYDGKNWLTRGNFKCPWGLTTLSNERHVVVCDADVGKVFVCSDSKPWRIVKTIKHKNFISPWYTCQTKEGGLVVSDRWSHKVFIFDKNYKFVAEYGQWGQFKDGLRYPAAVCVDKDGHIIVADYGNNRLVKIDDNGRYIGILLDKKDGILQPYSLAMKNNDLYVGQGNGLLKCFTYYHNTDFPLL